MQITDLRLRTRGATRSPLILTRLQSGTGSRSWPKGAPLQGKRSGSTRGPFWTQCVLGAAGSAPSVVCGTCPIESSATVAHPSAVMTLSRGACQSLRTLGTTRTMRAPRTTPIVMKSGDLSVRASQRPVGVREEERSIARWFPLPAALKSAVKRSCRLRAVRDANHPRRSGVFRPGLSACHCANSGA